MAKKIMLTLDDEEHILDLLEYNLEKNGYEVLRAETGEKGLTVLKNMQVDLVLLDYMLPGMDGIEVLKAIRSTKGLESLPVLMLTAKGEEFDKVLGLEMGADDYLVKPFSMRELGARIRAILRRMDPLGGAERPESVQEIVRGGLVLQIREHTLVKDGQPVGLTPTEFSLLQLFMKHPGQVFNRMQLLESTHGEAFDGYERTIDAHIRNLRRKIDEEPGMSRIETVYGIGYRFRGGM